MFGFRKDNTPGVLGVRPPRQRVPGVNPPRRQNVHFRSWCDERDGLKEHVDQCDSLHLQSWTKANQVSPWQPLNHKETWAVEDVRAGMVLIGDGDNGKA